MSGLLFTSENQRRLFETIVAELQCLGYTGDRLARGYAFPDWFKRDASGRPPERLIAAAAFGQTPVSYDTACFGVSLADESLGVGAYRALAAPVVFEVGHSEVVQWAIGVDDRTTVSERRFGIDDVSARFAENRDRWTPREFLRSKAIDTEKPAFQRSLFAGVIPELESNVRMALGPVLTRAVTDATQAYRSKKGKRPPENRLFQLTFALLAGKVFRDRGHGFFADLGWSSDPDTVIRRVAAYYGGDWPRLLTKDARHAAFHEIWRGMDFRNLSVDAVSHAWANTLVTKRLRKRLGIHRTPRSIVRHIVDRIPFGTIPEEERFVVEPCCGSAVFLVAALNRMRDLLDPDMDEQARHVYFQDRLTGFERDAFGREAARLCLALADYPQPNGWKINRQDVFLSAEFEESLRRARVVLCNPPFEDVGAADRKQYDAAFIRPPLEILQRVLTNLHPEGVIGFVLPQVFVSGDAYRSIRELLAKRFADFDLVTLTDTGWEHAQPPTALLIATEPRRHARSRVTHGSLGRRDWREFDWHQRIPVSQSGEKTPEQAAVTFAVPALSAVWRHLRHHSQLGSVASIHRGIEWRDKLIDPKTRAETGSRQLLVRPKPFPGSRRGVPPQARPVHAYETPPLAHLDMNEENVRRGYHHDWAAPKVILNAKRKSRYPWKVAAFVDRAEDGEGLVCYQTFTAVWPHAEWNLDVIAAVLNGPVANAYVHTHVLDQKDVRNDFLEPIPLPWLDAAQQAEIADLVRRYREAATRVADEFMVAPQAAKEAQALLLAIDALVLKGYDMPPRLERGVLDLFNGHRRKTSVPFRDYYPAGFRPCFSLAEYLSDEFRHATAGKFREDSADPPPAFLDALRTAMEAFGR